jgi:hypothetical protein
MAARRAGTEVRVYISNLDLEWQRDQGLMEVVGDMTVCDGDEVIERFSGVLSHIPPRVKVGSRNFLRHLLQGVARRVALGEAGGASETVVERRALVMLSDWLPRARLYEGEGPGGG